MTEPRRLSQSGGVAQRLLDSASIDRPSEAARRRAATFASTAGAFASTHSDSASASASPRPHVVKTLATWICVGAAASVALGFVGSRLLDTSGSSSRRAAGDGSVPAMAELPQAPKAVPAKPSDISPEPLRAMTPSSSRPPPSSASLEEARELEAARASASRGDFVGAIAELDTYDRAHPNGQLKPDSMALRIQLLNSTGKTSEARSLAAEFRDKYPQHPLLEQVRKIAPK